MSNIDTNELMLSMLVRSRTRSISTAQTQTLIVSYFVLSLILLQEGYEAASRSYGLS